VTNSLRGWVIRAGTRSLMTAVFCRFKGIPPNRATSGFLPARCLMASQQVRGPSGVVTVAWCFAAIFVTVERCFDAKVLSSEVSMTHRSRLSR
jgi:hypothetical protein